MAFERRVRWVLRLAIFNLGTATALVAGQFGGLFWLVPTVLISLLWSLSNAWLLVVQVANGGPLRVFATQPILLMPLFDGHSDLFVIHRLLAGPILADLRFIHGYWSFPDYFALITPLLYNTDAQLEGEAASRRMYMRTSDSY